MTGTLRERRPRTRNTSLAIVERSTELHAISQEQLSPRAQRYQAIPHLVGSVKYRRSGAGCPL